MRRYFANVRAVVEALRKAGPLTDAQYQVAIDRLGTEGEAGALYESPRTGSTLLLAGNIPEVLADAGVLPLVCRHFHVLAEARELADAARTLTHVEHRRAQDEWLSGLIDRLRAGLDDDRYHILPLTPASHDSDDDDEHGILLSGLRRLLSFPVESADVLWIDDRFVTGYWTRDTMPIFGTLEILQDLLERGLISETRRIDVLLRLRAGNARFVPLEGPEIAHHLSAATIRNGSVLESEALATIRRHTAALLLDARTWLQPPLLDDGTENPRSEVAVLVAVDRAATEALVAIWEDAAAAPEDRAARSDWVVNSLLLDFAMTRRVTGLRRPDDNDMALIAAQMGSLISLGARVGVHGGADGLARRRHYYEWLTAKILEPRFDADPAVLPLTAEYLKHGLFSLLAITDEDHVASIARALAFRQIFDDLPESVREELARDTTVMSSLQMETASSVTVGPYHFRQADFVRAAAATVNGQTALLKPFEYDHDVRFEPTVRAPGTVGLRLVDVSAAQTPFEIFLPILAVLSKSAAAREEALREHPEWFDGKASAFDEWVAQIASLDNAEERLTVAQSWQSDSARLYYLDLGNRLGRGDRLAYRDLLPPSATSLLRHFRLSASTPAGPPFERALDEAADELGVTQGLSEAVQRWWGLPARLPATLVRDLVAQPGMTSSPCDIPPASAGRNVPDI